MPYVEDENGDHIIDDDGNKIFFSVSYDSDYSDDEQLNNIYREMMHIDANNNINTENRHIVIKDGVDSNHAVSKGQLDIIKTEIINMIPSSDPVDPNAIDELIKTNIQIALTKYNNDLIKMINQRMKGRVGKKSLTIPKTNYTWIKLLSVDEIDGVESLDEVLIQDIYIKRTDRYHNAKSSHTANAFTNLEFFYDANRENYYCYFDNHPSSWSMECFLHYVKLPKELEIEEEEEEVIILKAE